MTPAEAADLRRRLDEEGLTNIILIEPLRFLAGQLVKATLLTVLVRQIIPTRTPRRKRPRR